MASWSLLDWLNGHSKKKKKKWNYVFSKHFGKKKTMCSGVKKKKAVSISKSLKQPWVGLRVAGDWGCRCVSGLSPRNQPGLGNRTQPFLVPASVGLMMRQLERKDPWFPVFVWLSQMTGGREMIFFSLTTDEFGSGQTMEQSQDRAPAQMKPGSKASGL